MVTKIQQRVRQWLGSHRQKRAQDIIRWMLGGLLILMALGFLTTPRGAVADTFIADYGLFFWYVYGFLTLCAGFGLYLIRPLSLRGLFVLTLPYLVFVLIGIETTIERRTSAGGVIALTFFYAFILIFYWGYQE